MGNIIQSQLVLSSRLEGILKPVIYCAPDDRIVAQAISINELLALKIATIRPKQRTIRLESCFREVLEDLPQDPIIKDFDVLFNPIYKVDVLKIMMTACKKKSFSIIWPGKYDDGKLFYAEDGYQDYKIFSVEDYDVTCII